MSALNNIREHLLTRSTGFIACNKDLMKEIGIRPTLIYTELLTKHIYYMNLGKLTHEGYFFCTIKDLYIATGLDGKKQRREIVKLEELGLLEQYKRGMPSKRYFKISNNVSLIKRLVNKGHKVVTKSEHLGLPKVPTNNTKTLKEVNKKKVNELLLQNEKQVFFISIIKYYLDIFEINKGIEHPILKDEYWIRVIDTIDSFLSCTSIDEVAEFNKMIDAHFESDKITDGNILAFAVEKVLKIKYYQAGFSGYLPE
jgi:hypothetical protein